MKDKFMEIAKETFGVFTNPEFSSKFRGIENNDEVTDILENSVRLINEHPKCERIKRQCVENEFDRNPKYREMILDTIMEDQELTSMMIGGFIARETGKDAGGTLEFNRRFILDNKFKNSEHTARISTTSRGDIRDEKNDIRDEYGYFRYDISKVETDD